MIKWAGYLKSLKLLFFGLLIICFTLLGSGFVNADYNGSHYQLAGLSSSTSFVDSQYEITFLKGGGLLTNFLGYSRNIFALNNKILFRRTPDGLPYIYAGTFNGYFSKASSCDSMLSGGDYLTPGNCSQFDVNLGVGPTIFRNFFSKVNQGDVVYYHYYDGGRPYNWNVFDLCFNSEELNKSLCFSSCWNYNGTCSSNLSGSIDFGTIDVSFSTVPYSYIGSAPGQNGYGGSYDGSSDGSTSLNGDSVITGDFVYSECTVGQAKKLAEDSGLNPYVCYAGLNISDTGLQIITAGTGSSVFDLFQSTNDGKNFRNWFDYRDKIFDNRYVYSNTIRQDYPSALYSYFNLYNQYGPEFTSTDIENYCRIIVNNLSESSKWTGLPSRCPIVSGPYINNGLGVNSSGEFNGNVAVGVNRDGVGNMSGNSNTDAITFIQNFFNKAKSVIPTDYNGVAGGVLPTYITLFLCALILFRFISH